MKKISSIFSILMLLLFQGSMFTSCSDIPEDERFVQLPNPTVVSDTIFKDKLSFTSTVLVEDFTGQKCTWCPEGTRLLTKAQETYGEDKVLPVAIHSGGLGVRSTSKIVGLMTDLGEYYWNKNGFSDLTAQPTAVFNRHITTDDRNTWEATILSELAKERNVALKAEATLTGNNVKMQLKMQAKDNVSAMLQLWLCENGIVAMQTDGGVNNKEYVHNHVLREAINGNDGEAVAITKDITEKSFEYTIDEKYVAKNCYIVAFVYDGSGVLQAIRIPFGEE